MTVGDSYHSMSVIQRGHSARRRKRPLERIKRRAPSTSSNTMLGWSDEMLFSRSHRDTENYERIHGLIQIMRRGLSYRRCDTVAP